MSSFSFFLLFPLPVPLLGSPSPRRHAAAGLVPPHHADAAEPIRGMGGLSRGAGHMNKQSSLFEPGRYSVHFVRRRRGRPWWTRWRVLGPGVDCEVAWNGTRLGKTGGYRQLEYERPELLSVVEVLIREAEEE